MRRKGFSWVEFAIVLAVLGVIAALSFPIFFGHGGHNAPRSACQSNLKQISLGFLQYIQDYDNKYPLVSSQSDGWCDSLQPYLKSTQIFQCPSGASSSSTYPDFSSDYFYNARLASYLVKKSSKTAQTILLGDGQDDAGRNAHITELPFEWSKDEYAPARRHLEGANYAFADGHVKWLRLEKVKVEMFTFSTS